MAQKAEHHYQDDYHASSTGSQDQSRWILAGLAALVALGLAIWFLSAPGTPTSTMNSAPSSAEQTAPPPEPAPAPEVQPLPAPTPAPAPAPAQ